jgi:hypothetical protein
MMRRVVVLTGAWSGWEGKGMNTADKWVTAVGAASSIGAAGFWLWASLIPVPDNQDTFISVLQKTSGINAIAAMCAAVASICAAYGFIKSCWG